MTDAMLQEVFLDANVLLHYLDNSSTHHKQVQQQIVLYMEENRTLYTSHHVLEEVLHITASVFGVDSLQQALNDIAAISHIEFIEPAPTIDFAHRYIHLRDSANIGLNDCLLLQLMLDNDIALLYTYDQKLAAAAQTLGIHPALTP